MGRVRPPIRTYTGVAACACWASQAVLVANSMVHTCKRMEVYSGQDVGVVAEPGEGCADGQDASRYDAKA
jgi:hypothetical protein